jgi:hypothetical protein
LKRSSPVTGRLNNSKNGLRNETNPDIMTDMLMPEKKRTTTGQGSNDMISIILSFCLGYIVGVLYMCYRSNEDSKVNIP